MRVLLVHRLNLGDLVCASPGMQWLRERHPEARLRLLTNDFAANVGALLPEVDEVYAYRKFAADGEPEWKQLLRARGWRPTRVIGLSLSPDRKLALRGWMLGPGRYEDPGHEREHAAERLAWQFGWRGKDLLPAARLSLPRERGTARDVAIWVPARKPSNRVTSPQVIGIVRALRARRPGVSIGVFDLPARTDSTFHVADAAAQEELATLLRGEGLELQRPPIGKLLAELASSASLIAPDGGVAHVAAAFGKPVIALFGDVPPAVWRPWSPLARALQATSRRVADIAPATIADAWADLGS